MEIRPLAAHPTPLPRKQGYAPEDGSFLWDSWVAERPEGGFQLYHLSAPADPDPNSRHDRAQIRTAFSRDLRTWQDTGFALQSGPPGSWDDGPIWTGCTLCEKGTTYLFYTGRNQRDGQTQRIGLATSKDGRSWERPDHPLLEADGRWYETNEESPVYRAWRDPYVVRDPDSGKYCMFFTAKTKDGDPTYRGCIGLATADQLEGPYQVQPPVLAPGHYAQMECPQVIERDGKWYLFFSSDVKDYSPDWAARIGGAQTGLHAYVGDSLRGPFRPVNQNAVVSGTDSNLYAVRLVNDPQRPGQHLALGWFTSDRNCAMPATGPAVGGACGATLQVHEKAFTLSEPRPVRWEGERVSF